MTAVVSDDSNSRIRRIHDTSVIRSSVPSSSRIQRIDQVPAPYKPLQATPPSTISELATNADARHRSWMVSDEVLLDILLGPFEANWFKAKDCLTMDHWPLPKEHPKPSHDTGIRLMQALVTMRKATWGAFISTVVKPQFEERMRMFGEVTTPLVDVATRAGAEPASAALDPAALGGDAHLQGDLDLHDQRKADPTKSSGKNLQDIFDSVGAEAVTSDVDLASGGTNSELGVQFVNSRFRTHFKAGKVIPYDPGTVFDINVYASDWIHGEAGFADTDTDTPGAKKRTITPAAEVKGMSESDQLVRAKRMEVWSLVKVRRNLDVDGWTSYRNQTLAALTDDAARAEMEAKLRSADTEFSNFELKVATRQAAMSDKLAAQEAVFFKGKASAFGGDHHGADAKFTRAANAIYEETLQTVKELRVRIEKLRVAPVQNDEAISNLGVLVADKIAEALTYANEVYATEGAVQHTVLKQGAAKKLANLRTEKKQTQLVALDYDLKPNLYMQAVNENVGDSLHSINHFSTFPHYAVYRAGKYLSRLCDATSLLLGSGTGVASYPELFEIGTESVRVKKMKSGDIEGDPEFVKKDDFFKKYEKGHLPGIRAQIIAFGASVPKLAGDKQQRDAEAKQAADRQTETVKAATKAADGSA